ncbi:hypothetical protein KR222_007966 [Zaprionus bogoriensis]|nr:hypothetical protein KR222_007966 [Zaprionus bogoriensis]
MTDLFQNRCSQWLGGLTLRQLARYYHGVYVYVSLFAVTFGLLLYRFRQRIYTLSLSWERILVLYSIACLMALLVALLCWYGWLVGRLLRAQYRIYYMTMRRLQIVLDIEGMHLLQPEQGK